MRPAKLKSIASKHPWEGISRGLYPGVVAKTTAIPMRPKETQSPFCNASSSSPATKKMRPPKPKSIAITHPFLPDFFSPGCGGVEGDSGGFSSLIN